MTNGTLCGLWIDDAGTVHTCRATPEGGRREAAEPFKPFAWLGGEVPTEGVRFERLKGELYLTHAGARVLC